MLRDFDLGAPNRLDSRRVEILADGLPLFGGAQLAVDATLVSALRAMDQPTPMLRTSTEQFHSQLEGGKKTPRARAGWLYWQAKWEADGRRKLGGS